MSRKEHKINIIIITSLTSFITPFMGSAVNICLPSIDKEFGMNPVSLSWVATAYLLTSAIFLLPFGRIADIVGRKKIYMLGIIVYSAFSLLCGLSVNSIMLIISRIFQGIGGAMIFGTGIAILTSVFGEGERGKIFGINTAIVYIGLASGPFFGGMLTQYLGWRSIFLLTLPFGLLSIIMILTSMHGEWIEARKEKFDYKGTGLYGVMIVAIIYGLSLLPTIYGLIILAGGLILIPIFINFENKNKSPMLNLELFRTNRTFTLSNLAALLNYCGTFAVGFTVSLYLQYVKGLTPQAAGFILVAQPIVMAVGSPAAGIFSDKTEPGKLASAGMILTTAALTSLIFLNQNSTNFFIAVNLMILGLGFSLFASPNTNAIMSSVEKRYYGVASGTLSTMRLTGQMISMAITMLVFALLIGKVQISKSNINEFLFSLKIIFGIMALLNFAGIFASYARGKTKKKMNEQVS
jgi:MFS family permease